MGVEVRTLDAVALMRKLSERSEADQQWLDEHEGEFDDLVYEESVGRDQSWAQGSMVGSPNVFKA